jgi:hypothetical protein
VRLPRPRQEYLDAFDDDVFAAGAPHRNRSPTAPGPGPLADRAAEGGEPPVGDEDPDTRPKGGTGGRSRTFGGVAAAAVTTVLAVVVAGQFAADGREGGAARVTGDVPREGADGVSRSDDRPRPTEPAPRVAYESAMAQKYPLDPELAASGAFRTVGGHQSAPGTGAVVRYRVDVERGLPLDAELFARAVHTTLNDDRSWGHGGTRTFERVSSGDVDFAISLASPATTAKWCAKSGLDTTVDNVSCDSAATERVMINAYRWAQGARTFGGEMLAYRQMLINHEVGHRLGRGHEDCTRQGGLAPVMMQQTKFLATDGVTCRPNAWPFPGR